MSKIFGLTLFLMASLQYNQPPRDFFGHVFSESDEIIITIHEVTIGGDFEINRNQSQPYIAITYNCGDFCALQFSELINALNSNDNSFGETRCNSEILATIELLGRNRRLIEISGNGTCVKIDGNNSILTENIFHYLLNLYYLAPLTLSEETRY